MFQSIPIERDGPRLYVLCAAEFDWPCMNWTWDTLTTTLSTNEPLIRVLEFTPSPSPPSSKRELSEISDMSGAHVQSGPAKKKRAVEVNEETIPKAELKHPSPPVDVAILVQPSPQILPEFQHVPLSMTFQAFLKAQQSYYIRWSLRGMDQKEVNSRRQSKHSGPIPISILKEIPFPPFLHSSKLKLVDAVLRVANRDYIYPWHQDWTSNLLLQILGTKLVYLRPPRSDLEKGDRVNHEMEQGEYISRVSRSGHVGLTDTDTETRVHVEASMEVEDSDMLVMILRPGDGLFIPAGWLHSVEVKTREPSLSINYFYHHMT